MREVDRPLEPGQVPDVLRDGAGEAVEGEVEPFQRGELGAEPGGERAREVVARERERAEPAAFEDRGREGAVDGVGGEVEDLEVGQVPEVLGELAVERVPVEDEALERGRTCDELGWDGPEEAVAAKVEVAERGRERGPRERRDEELLREGERDDATGLGGAGARVRGGAGDPVPGAGVRGGGVPVGERPRGVLQDGRLEREQRLAVRRERVGGGGDGEMEEQKTEERHGESALGGGRVGSLGLRTPESVRRKGRGCPLVSRCVWVEGLTDDCTPLATAKPKRKGRSLLAKTGRISTRF